MTPGSAGYDLYSAQDVLIPPFDRAVCLTDLAIEVPRGCYGRIAPRSGLALHHNLDVGAGVIDPDYRGNVGIILINMQYQYIRISRGARIAQLVCERYELPDIQEVATLDPTVRGSKGFGSSGMGIPSPQTL